MQIKELLYDGKSKQLFATDDNNAIVIAFKDQALAFGGLKRSKIEGKGMVNATVCECLYKILESEGSKTHFIKKIDKNKLLVKKLDMIPLIVKVRNRAAGSLSARMAWYLGKIFKKPIIEICVKDAVLKNPLVNETHIEEMKIASHEEVAQIKDISLRINAILKNFLNKEKISLIDVNLEFGRDEKGNIYLADDISADNSRLWDAETEEPLDMDRFRWGLGDIDESYRELLNRILSAELEKDEK